MKAAGHELKGVSAVHDTGVRDLHLPLICIIDYRGFRVVAMSLLPIDGEKTIIYGSPNAGRTVFTTDDRFNQLVKKVRLLRGVLPPSPFSLFLLRFCAVRQSAELETPLCRGVRKTENLHPGGYRGSQRNGRALLSNRLCAPDAASDED